MSKILYLNDFDAMSYEELTLPMNTSKSWTMLNHCEEVMMMLNLFCDVKDRRCLHQGLHLSAPLTRSNVEVW